MATPQTRRDLTWLDDASIAGTSYADTENQVWSRQHVAHVIDVLHQGTEGSAAFFAEEGDQPEYLAWAVLDWLGY
jgi:hypothetical protein